ncbi:MAG: hypothetical protein IJH55_03250 [Romboutsia sp.]|nr:hypothetical protein [Romboutsia sp.]
MRTTHTDRIEQYFREHGSITSWEAIKEFGITRLSAVIYNLRYERKLDIETRYETMKNRYGDKVTFARYVYKGVME